MADYISREAVLKCIDEDGYDNGYDLGYVPHNKAFKELIKALPAADVVERKRGRFIIEDKYIDYRTERCSVCGFVANRPYIQDIWNFCPHCGAEMGGEQDG